MNIGQELVNLCRYGDFDGAKKHLELNSDIPISDYEHAFRWACKNGHVPTVELMLAIKPTVNVSAYDNFAFKTACKKGFLQVAKIIYAIDQSIDISANNEHLFRAVCTNGHLEVAKWLLEIKPDIKILAKKFCACKLARVNGHDKVVQWLLEIKQGNYKTDVDFRYACVNGNLPLAKKLFEEKPAIDISYNNEFAFRMACANGHLEVAKWFLETKPDINIYAQKNQESNVFTDACLLGHLDLVKWLVSVDTKQFDGKFNLAHGLVCALKKCHFKVAMWLYETEPNIIDDECVLSFTERVGEQLGLIVIDWLNKLESKPLV